MRNQPEKEFIGHIKKIMGPDWILSKIETRIGSSNIGVSDCAYSCSGRHGWIEFKYQKEWPKRRDTIVRLKHFTRNQKQFLYRHGKHGKGGCFLFLHIEDQILVFDWRVVHYIGKLNRMELETLAVLNLFYGTLTKFELCNVLLRM